MYCRYCRAMIAEDSVYCAKCGRRLVRSTYPAVGRVVSALRLKTPYPYFAVLVLLFVAWTLRPRQSGVDYSAIKVSLQLDQKLDLPEEHTFKQAMSLVVENTGGEVIRDVPVEIRVRVEPSQPADVLATFLGRQLFIMQGGRPLPLIVVLADAVEPGEKRRYLLEGSVEAEPPFKVTYEVLEEDAGGVLAAFVVEL